MRTGNQMASYVYRPISTRTVHCTLFARPVYIPGAPFGAYHTWQAKEAISQNLPLLLLLPFLLLRRPRRDQLVPDRAKVTWWWWWSHDPVPLHKQIHIVGRLRLTEVYATILLQ